MERYDENPIVSIIIPTFNQEIYIRKCLKVLQNQTLKEIEIIVSDDASTDNTIPFVESEMQEDNRIKLLRAEKNQGTFIARNRGIASALGKYIMFVDSDDELSLGLCEELVSLQESKEEVDILHFSSEAIDCGAGQKVVEMTTKYIQPYEGKLMQLEILKKCFGTREYGATLWNKLFSSELCKKVVKSLPKIYATKGEDMLLYFFLAVEAKSYLGIKTQNKYFYNYGLGGSGQKEYTVEDLEKYCCCGRFFPLLESYNQKVEEEDKKNSIEIAIEDMRVRLIDAVVMIWKNKIDTYKKAEGIKTLLTLISKEDVLSSLCRIYKENIETIATTELWQQILQNNNVREIKTIALYYCELDKKKNIVSLALEFLKLGYKVVIISEKEFENILDDMLLGVKQYSICPIKEILTNKKAYRERVLELMQIFENEQIDMICYHEVFTPALLYDLLITKWNNIKFVLFKHEPFLKEMSIQSSYLEKEKVVFPLVDKLVVSSDIECIFWKTLGIKTIYDSDLSREQWIQELVCFSKEIELEQNSKIYAHMLDAIISKYSFNCQEIRMEREEMQKIKWVKDIVLKVHKNNLRIALYPFGVVGKKIKELLEENGLFIEMIVDNKLSKVDSRFHALIDLKEISCDDYLFIICSNKQEIYEEIRKPLKAYVKQENIYDLYPRDKQ